VSHPCRRSSTPAPYLQVSLGRWIALSVASASGLDGKGSADCISDASYWGGIVNIDPATCSSAENTTAMLCGLKVYYAIGSQSVKKLKRSLECKFEGVAQVAEDGDITGFSADQDDSLKNHILQMPIHN
jgi:hypothetical protein